MPKGSAVRAWWDRLPLPAEPVVLMLVPLAFPGWRAGRRLPRAVGKVGWPLVAGGVILNVWAVVARGGEDLEHPERLTTVGPHEWTRNPMYVGWSLIHLGVGLAARSPWVMATSPITFALVHRGVLREEDQLAAWFGAEFTEYRERVPRYVGRPRRGT